MSNVPDRCLVGASPVVVRIRAGRVVSGSTFTVLLRRRRPIDSPLVLALPLLVAEYDNQ
ncbi:hypothetical protein [Longimycelium tulufanense]|uniref:hypothetical protein n=1 Tax=Longimycelium tulufanense TaxID=907463 RepID=UPI001665B6EA|nr:hypothetical protein [Longimycelium tulufanense]